MSPDARQADEYANQESSQWHKHGWLLCYDYTTCAIAQYSCYDSSIDHTHKHLRINTHKFFLRQHCLQRSGALYTGAW